MSRQLLNDLPPPSTCCHSGPPPTCHLVHWEQWGAVGSRVTSCLSKRRGQQCLPALGLRATWQLSASNGEGPAAGGRAQHSGVPLPLSASARALSQGVPLHLAAICSSRWGGRQEERAVQRALRSQDLWVSVPTLSLWQRRPAVPHYLPHVLMNDTPKCELVKWLS